MAEEESMEGEETSVINSGNRNGNEQKESGDEVIQLPEADEISIKDQFSTGIRVVIVAILLTSVLYTLALTGIGNLFWKGPARGSLVTIDGRVVGSKLIGQPFDSAGYFHPRPSSKGYDAMDSGSANLAPTNDRITERAKSILEELKQEGIQSGKVPVSFVTESGSALDPHITPQSAKVQIPRIARATALGRDELEEIVNNHVKGRFLGLFGLKRVNVLKLNLEIDSLLGSD